MRCDEGFEGRDPILNDRAERGPEQQQQAQRAEHRRHRLISADPARIGTSPATLCHVFNWASNGRGGTRASRESRSTRREGAS